MVGDRLWKAKQDEELAKAVVKEDLAVAVHRDDSVLKSLPSSVRKIGQKHPGEQQPLQEIVQTKVVAKAKEAKGGTFSELKDEKARMHNVHPSFFILQLIDFSAEG